MQTDILDQAKQPHETGHPRRLSWGAVTLTVTDLDRAVAFWTRAFGIRVRTQDSQKAELGTQTQTLIVLHAGASIPVSTPHLGMYHVAIGMPDQNEFSRVLARLIAQRIRISPTDHLSAKSIYFSDPDGLEIEIVLETPERFGRFGDLTKGLIMYDIDGQPHSGRDPLDVQAELAYAQGADLEAPLDDKAFVAHLHFKVSDIDPAAAWFGGIGFDLGVVLDKWGFADMSAGGPSPHSLAMNTWAGPNLSPAPANMARMIGYTLYVHDPDVIAKITGFQASDGGLTAIDPTGTKVTLIPAL